MKLIYIADVRIPTEKAHGIGIMKLCEGFSSIGANIQLLVPRRFNFIKTSPFDYYGIKKKFLIKKIFHIDLIPLENIFGQFSSRLSYLFFSFFSFFYILVKDFNRNNFYFSRNTLPLFLLSFFSKNIFYEIHSFPNFDSSYIRFSYRIFLKRLSGIITTNSFKKEVLVEKFKVSPDKILICHNGVDIKKFDLSEGQKECRKKLKLSEDIKMILYSGHLYKWKGVDVLAEAAKLLPKNIDIYFVGGTEKDVERFKKRYLDFSNIKIIGHKPYFEIPYWLKSADILVLPSTAEENISNYWTSPIKLFEYMASKTPIVASDVFSNKEILNKDNSFLIKPDDPKALAFGVSYLLENNDLSKKISVQAFRDVQQYTWENRAKKIYEFMIESCR
jgi:glycosyltransferase involved in cell wall biosynthesis